MRNVNYELIRSFYKCSNHSYISCSCKKRGRFVTTIIVYQEAHELQNSSHYFQIFNLLRAGTSEHDQ
jgi:hypothetical protein